ncbi:MAG: acyl CoA:acetate/3-ketoacid CoA transferase [SAR324 cluster bacterium]|nr:acyl CoA:acetate/3-ketoacid CoA transferase [SAR324 cluster bacterium]
MVKLSKAREIAEKIPDEATLALSGSGGGLLEADYILQAIENCFLETGHPKNITLVHALGIGDGKGSGVGRFAHKGMVRRVVGGHWSWAPEMQKLARNNEIEAYSLPAGMIQTLFREIGAGRPGVISSTGLGTFADPIHGGGKCNSRAKEEIVERVHFAGEELLWYKPFEVDVAIVCGSALDVNGNISTSREAADIDVFSVALAGHNSGGQVFAQVGRVLETGICPARLVCIPGVLIDEVVVYKEQQQTSAGVYDPIISGEREPPPEIGVGAPPEGVRRIVCARAAEELQAGKSVNFGFGIPDGIPALARELGKNIDWMSVEQGLHNAELLGGALFGAGRYPQAILSSNDQFDFYNGGGVDLAFLGMGQIDRHGNVNVSWIGEDIVGPGGFIDITQSAKKVVFCGTFEAKGLKVTQNDDGRISIQQYGEIGKIVEEVRHITFSGNRALETGQQVLYITERAVFDLTSDGIRLIEISPGVDLQRDVLERIPFEPLIAFQA